VIAELEKLGGYMDVFFIADTHFGHENIIRYEKRPFSNANEMANVLIKNWNNAVSKKDKVFVLGDFSFYPKEKTTQICKSLNGEKFLVKGNHDGKSDTYYLECGFAHVCQYPIIYDQFWILSHEPFYVNTNMPYANIFGHVHGNKIYADHSPQSYCVSVERINYTPINYEKIKVSVSEA
jgi:calcineurin-like phosphoesterase family protein